MLQIYRRHNPQKCTSTDTQRCTNKKRPCAVWVYGVTPDGRTIRESLKTRDWVRATSKVQDWETEGKKPVQPHRTTVEEWRDTFLSDAAHRKLNSETIRKYKFLFSQLTAFAQNKGIRHVAEIDLPMLTEFRASWKDGALSSSKKLERLRSVSKFALVRKWVAENYAVHLKPPKIKLNPTLPFSHDEMVAILNKAEGRTKTFVLTMRFSGLRISDTTILTTDSLKGSRLQLYQAKTGEPVSVLLPDFVAKALRQVKNSNPKHFFWTGKSTMPAAVSVWRKRLAEVFKNAGVKNGHSHRFRDTFAVGLLQSGVSIENVSTLLGHQSLKVTQRHYSPWIKTRQEALDKSVQIANRSVQKLYKAS